MIEFKVLPIAGYKSLRALNGFHSVLLGLKMTPGYMTESYEDFFKRIGNMPIEDQAKFIREGVNLVELTQEEVEAMVGFCADKNGIPFGPAQLKTMQLPDILEMVCAICLEIAKMKIDLVTEAQKKN